MANNRPAQAVMADIRQGNLMTELAQAFHDAAEAVKEYDKPAKITVTFVIAAFKGDHKLVQPPMVVTGEVETKLPKDKLEATVLFMDEDGNLSRTQVREPELPLSVARLPNQEGSSNAG